MVKRVAGEEWGGGGAREGGSGREGWLVCQGTGVKVCSGEQFITIRYRWLIKLEKEK